MEPKGNEAWLCRRPVADLVVRDAWRVRLRTVSHPEAAAGTPLRSAVDEALASLEAMLGVRPVPAAPGAVGGLVLRVRGSGVPGSFELSTTPLGVDVLGADPAGVLYGVFRLLDHLALGERPERVRQTDAPAGRLRILNHWDNFDGSVERGYAGRSLFFRDGEVLAPSPRLVAYARLLASVGLGGVVLNNVNVHAPETGLTRHPHLDRVAALASVLGAWGVRLYLSVNFAAPVTLGDLDTADPLDTDVAAWWQHEADRLWKAIPDLGGLLVKADSEGRPGPFTYGRDHADGANLLARAVAPHGGTVFWRCFVYNHLQDWRDRKTDRARAAYDHFKPLDGKFLPNVVLQIKNGPMDFQPREPVSPLLGALDHTRFITEFQVTQEYTGQQRHLCYLAEQWRTYLDFDTGAPGGMLSQRGEGIAGVSNLGDDPNWTGHDLAQANWYAFGRLAWNPSLAPSTLAHEWASLTFGAAVADEVAALLLGSWETYEAYTAPLGVGWMVNPSHHYGPNPDGYEYDRWGTYHFADRDGVGVDRTTATGTGYVGQYPEPVARTFESVGSCPDELLLFFHHVPYTHRLRSGATVIQHIYDSHFKGADRAAQLCTAWDRLEGRVDPETFARVRARFAEQAIHAALWRDVVNTYFYRKSGIADTQGRLVHP